MQDIHSIGSGGGRLFGGGGDRRLRPHSHLNQQALKCPRCESLNTKFCYYNNYNLSQPRHFCKSCRRYWTKGGVLRNVPVGGGCRKTKRSKPKQPNSDAAARERKSDTNSSSESSSLTATTAATAPNTTTAAVTVEVVSGNSSTSASHLLNFQDSRFFIPHTANPSFDTPVMDHTPDCDRRIFPGIGSFTSLMTSSSDPSVAGFSVADISSYQLHQQGQGGQVVENQGANQQWQKMDDDMKMQQEMTAAGYLDQTAQIEYSGIQNRVGSGGLAAVDWQAGVDQGLFDLTGTDDQAYWSQAQWNDADQPLNYYP
ncbi:hypothetical protein RJ639_021840 [Escallonia herrerae]|uniref:Dof zinc finger protein n=1 Tax=Escallonia herrerae TaxID=1293975 RepID=A0AA88V370_9ASTE|nr:hypothetical protein RJ639_021840 [Escallonia herrerae]